MALCLVALVMFFILFAPSTASATHVTDPQISALLQALRIPECTHPQFSGPKKMAKKNTGPRGTAHCFTKASLKKNL